MKRLEYSRLLVLAGLVCLGMSACHNDSVDSDKNPIMLAGHIDAESRGTDLNLQSTELVEGRTMGITIQHAENEHTNGVWKVGRNGQLVNMGEGVYWGDKEIAVCGYHPYQQDWTDVNSDFSFSVNIDQSTDEGYLGSDLLWGSTTSTPYDGIVLLTFKHKLAKINVILSSDEIEDLSGATISVCGTNVVTMFNPLTGALSSASTEDIMDIKAGVTDKASLTSSCIIVPQTIEKGASFIKVDHQDKTYTYLLSNPISFTSGKVYNFNLEIRDGELGDVTGSASDIPWGE